MSIQLIPYLFFSMNFFRNEQLSILNTTVSLITPISVSLKQGAITSSQKLTRPTPNKFIFRPFPANKLEIAGFQFNTCTLEHHVI